MMSITKLNVIGPSVIMPKAIMMSVIMLSFIMPSVMMPSAIMLSVIIQSVLTPSVLTPIAFMLSVIMPSVFLPNDMAPLIRLNSVFKILATSCFREVSVESSFQKIVSKKKSFFRCFFAILTKRNGHNNRRTVL
jgi:hypothetical protein